MVKFKSVTIENYKSIGHVHIEFQPGLYKVTGENLDSSYTSNGAAKSSTLQAIMLCLYNRDYSGAPLESLNNRTTGRPYRITTILDWYNGSDVVEVQVVNSKYPGQMQLTIDGVHKAKGARDVIPWIERILGMGAQTFRLTHFITSATILELTQNLSQPQLFNDILHLAELQDLDKRLLAVQKDINAEATQLEREVNTMSKILSLLELKDQYNQEELQASIEVVSNTLDELDTKFSLSDATSTSTIAELTSTITKLSKDINDTKASLRNGMCSLCGSLLIDRQTMEVMNTQILEYEGKLHDAQDQHQKLVATHKLHQHKYQDAKAELQKQLADLKADLNMAKQVEDLEGDTSKFTEQSPRLQELRQQLDILASARKLTKSGVIVKDIMDRFFDLVQLKVSEYSALINLEHFQIHILNEKLGMVIQLQQGGVEVPIESLSNGEKTRLSLLVLMAMLDSMKCISDSETNMVVLDEASSSFDASGVDELSRLFSHMKQLGQSIFLITHGSELDAVPYDYELRAVKQGGISSVSITAI